MDRSHSPDNVLNVEESLSKEPVIRKRRSSVFQSKSIIPNGLESSQAEDNKIVDNSKGDQQLQEETFNLEEYITRLRNERKEWRKILKEREKQRIKLTKEKLYAESQGQFLDYSILNEYEKAFVSAKPNYQNICKNYEKLLDISLQTRLLSTEVYKLNQNVISQMEGRLDTAAKEIIKELES